MRADTNQVIDKFDQFYRNRCREDVLNLAKNFPHDQKSLVIDWEELSRFDSDLADDYLDQPEQLRQYAEEALRLYDKPIDVDLANAHVRVSNLPRSIPIRELRSGNVNTLVQLEGIVRNNTDVRPKVEEAAFECQRCGTLTRIPQNSSDMSEPHECQGCERQGPFNINYGQSEFVDSQAFRIQESPEGLRGGETPQNINIRFEDDLTGVVTPGDKVEATGILRLEDKSGQDKSTTFDMYVEGVALRSKDEKFEDFDISEEERQEIEAISNKPDLYEQFRDGIAPAIYGYPDEKMAIMFQLFGGYAKDLPDESRIRGDLHVLLIGDPGTGKSQMISYVQNLAPRAVYTSGKGSSAAGLTASAVQSDMGDGSEWTLEAGALVLADQGIAAVDELDKMSEDDRSAMHEALEQQKISVSKAGINATLKSRCSLLAAANPKYGRFDEYEPIAEQIDLEPALVSRFDLIFTVTDTPDEKEDRRLAQHIVDSNYAGQLHTKRNKFDNSNISQDQVDGVTDTVEPPIDPDIFRKYVAFAKQNCFPQLTDEAREHIEDFYVKLRKKGDDEDSPVPVTARKLEALIRLTEASARTRLSDTATIEDANRATSLAQSSLEDVGIDPETGQYDANMVESGTSKTQRDRVKNLKGIISEHEDLTDDGAPAEEVMQLAESAGMDHNEIEHELEKLKQKGEIYQPTQDHYRTT